MSTELKTDSWCRYMLYRKEDYSKGIFFTREEKRAVEAGSKFTMAAYPDVWARDAGLVKRVRQFLGDNFHWHDRLSKSGSNLEVMQTLRDMVRGGSVVVIPETAVSGAVGSSSRAPTAPARKSFLDLVMEKMELSHDEATKYIDDYNDRMLRIDAIAAQYQRGKAASRADAGSDALTGGDAGTPTSLRDAQPFEYQPVPASLDDVEQDAGNIGMPGNNQAQNKQFRSVVKGLGLDKDQAQQLHQDIAGENLGGRIRNSVCEAVVNLIAR